MTIHGIAHGRDVGMFAQDNQLYDTLFTGMFVSAWSRVGKNHVQIHLPCPALPQQTISGMQLAC
jgi:hypothetical protein